MQFVEREITDNGGFFEHYRFDESDGADIVGTHLAAHIFVGRDDEGRKPEPVGWVVTHPGGKTCQLAKGTVMGDVVECVTSWGTDRHPTRWCRNAATMGGGSK